MFAVDSMTFLLACLIACSLCFTEISCGRRCPRCVDNTLDRDQVLRYVSILVTVQNDMLIKLPYGDLNIS